MVSSAQGVGISMKKGHKIGIDIQMFSEAMWKWWILRKRNIKSLIENEPYKLRIRFKNLSNRRFSGGRIQIVIVWSSQCKFHWFLEIPELNGNEELESRITRSDEVGSRGLALVYCYSVTSKDRKNIMLWNFDGSEKYSVGAKLGYAIHGVYCMSWRDLHTRYGFLVSAIGLGIVAFERIVLLLLWAARLLTSP